MCFRIKWADRCGAGLGNNICNDESEIVWKRCPKGIFHIDNFQMCIICKNIGSMEVAMNQCFWLAHKEVTQFISLEFKVWVKANWLAIFFKFRTAGRIVLICSENIEEDAVLHNNTQFCVHKMCEKLAVFFCWKIEFWSIKMCGSKILCALFCQFREKMIFIHLETNELQIWNIFHNKYIVFRVAKIQSGNILRNNLCPKFHNLVLETVTSRSEGTPTPF